MSGNFKKIVAASGLLCLGMSGCATTTQTILPDCTLPPMPVLEDIPSSDLEALTDEVYWKLMDRERRITDSLLEHRALLTPLCE